MIRIRRASRRDATAIARVHVETWQSAYAGLLPDSMLRRRQYGVEVIWAGLLAAVRPVPWNRVAAELGVPYTTVREWLRRSSPAGGPGACVAVRAAAPAGG
jgi:hypothetical protein